MTTTPPGAHARCANCGGENEPAQLFCGACGHPLLLACPACGNASPRGFRFCGHCGAELTALAPRRSGEERRVVTVLFVDLVGFTSRSEQLDPEDVQAFLDPYYACVRDEIQAFGGEVEKYVGDAVVGLFGAPIAHGDDPERAVRAALRIREALGELNAADPNLDLQARIAVNTGEAIVALGARMWAGETMMTGDSVNTAARLQGAAPLNSVLVGEETYRATRFVIDYESVEPIPLKGKQTPVRAWLALAASRLPGERALRSVPLVSRREELAALAERFDHVLARGHAHLATVFGQPGVGKSRLATEFAARVAGTGGRTIRGRSFPYGESGAYGAFAQQVKQVAQVLDTDSAALVLDKLRQTSHALGVADDHDEVASHLGALLGLEPSGEVAERQALFRSARLFVEALAARRPTVLVFEDLQWADPSLLDLVEHLASRVKEAPLMILGLARPEFVSERPTWGAGLPACTTLSLQPLDAEESRELARRLLARAASEATEETAARLATTGEGNPLFIEELVAALSEQPDPRAANLPTSIRGIVASRLDALPVEERSVLLDASIVGKVFWHGALARLGEHGERLGDVLDVLEGRDLIRREAASRIAGEQQYRFKHMLIRDVAYATLPRGRRRQGHAVVAGYLEEAGLGRDSLAVLAHHWREAGDLEKSIGYFVAVAEQSQRGWAKEEAVRYYREALRLIPEDDVARRRHVRLQCAVAEQMAFHLPDAESLTGHARPSDGATTPG